jgi:septum site-determining protein MinD
MKQMTRIIVITSGKGGVGKTTTAVNLGAALNYFGKNVLVVDANLSTPNVGIHLGSPEVPINLNHVIAKKADLVEAVYEHESGMKILPASLSIREFEKTKTEKLKDIKKGLGEIAEYIILDCAAGLGDEAMSAINLSDEIIIITNPEMPAITDALKAIKMAEDRKKIILGVIMTRVRKDQIEIQPETVREMLEIPILGMIPEDEYIRKALSRKDAVVHTYPKSKPSRAYKEIAAKLLGIAYDSEKDKERLLTRFLKAVKLKRD